MKLGSIFQPVKMMSGGNLQKLLLGREIAAKPKLMIVLYPVRGLDIGAIEAVHKLLLQLKEEQTAYYSGIGRAGGKSQSWLIV